MKSPLHRRRVDLFVGRRCTNDCWFCNEGGRHGERQSHSLAEARALLARTPDVKTVFLTRGEPTLRRELPEFAELARAHGAEEIVLVTNGRRLRDAELLGRTLAAGVNEVRISVHGHTAELHDHHTRAPGAFEQLLAGLANLRAARTEQSLRIVLLVVVTQANLPHVGDIYRWALGEQVDRVGFGLVRPSGLAALDYDNVAPRYTEAGRVFRELLATLHPRRDHVTVDSLPPCVVRESYRFLGARMRLVSTDPDGALVERDEHWEKSYGPPCATCRLRSVCEGVWTGYVQKLGWDEFQPVTSLPWEPEEVGTCLLSTSNAPPGVPLVVVTNDCNNGCRFCRREPATTPRTTAALRERLLLLARSGVEEVRLGGGEPTLDESLAELLAEARELGLRVTLVTNARRLAYERYVVSLAAAPPEALSVPIFGGAAAQHDARTRAEGSFEQTLRGIRNARRRGWAVNVHVAELSSGDSATAELRTALERWGCAVLPLELDEST